ncbi:hypothetical protein HMN09_00565200 [Mycena chlorophos]|uniref:GPI anchored protein n=1 Tax=Mycena chlorophos TaxID=658473 RepID=A0A8H6TC53_MYCCL|nr:hypothetical protein HMN09_00565200 [Mycena chlorophos]
MHTIAILALVCAGVSAVAASPTRGSPSPHPAARTLVPFKRRSEESSLQSRSARRRALVPKDVVVVDYGLPNEVYPSTSLKFLAHESTPIVLLEDFDHLVHTVSCQPHGASSSARKAHIEINFRSKDAFAEALEAWSAFEAFTLVTAHSSSGCNAEDTRGAWTVTNVRPHALNPQITLHARPIPLREMGKSYKISHTSASVSSSWKPRSTGLDKRFDKLVPLGNTLDIAPRQQLFPIVSSLLSAREGNSDSGIDTSASGDLTVFCVDCISTQNFTVGIELDVADLGTSIKAAHVNVTVVNFEHDVQLELALDGSASISKEVDVIRAALPDLGISIPDVANIGFFYGASVSADFEIDGGVNFTIGAKTSVPSGATATHVLAGNGSSQATGWDASSFELIPFRLNSGSLNATAQLSLSPFLEIDFDLLTSLSNVARLAIDTPQLVATASLKTNVNEQCEPVGAEDFTYFTAALTFGAGANLNIRASANSSIPGLAEGDATVTLFAHDAAFGSFPSPDQPECFIIADDSVQPAAAAARKREVVFPRQTAAPTPATASAAAASISAALASLVPASTGTLLPATSAVPSFDIPKIESFFSANGALPTGVNYTQLAQVTQVPSDLQHAVTSLLHGSAMGLRLNLPVFVIALGAIVGAGLLL